VKINESILVLAYDVGGGVGVDDAKAQVDDIKATCEIANRSMDKPRKFDSFLKMKCGNIWVLESGS
jgi:hypothetical protein